MSLALASTVDKKKNIKTNLITFDVTQQYQCFDNFISLVIKDRVVFQMDRINSGVLRYFAFAFFSIIGWKKIMKTLDHK